MPDFIRRRSPARFCITIRLTCLVISLIGVCLANPVHGQTWSGAGNTDLWSNADNWVGGTPPQNNGFATVNFDDSAQQFTSDQNISNFALRNINVDTDQTFTFEGFETILEGSINMNGTGTAVFNNEWITNNMSLRGSGGLLILNGNVRGNDIFNIERDVTINGFLGTTDDINLLGGTTRIDGGISSNSDEVVFLEQATLAGSGSVGRRVIARNGGSALPTIDGSDGLRFTERISVDNTTLQIVGGTVEANDGVGFFSEGDATLLIKSGGTLGGSGTTTVSLENQTITIESGGSIGADHTLNLSEVVVISGDPVPAPGFLNGAGSVEGQATLNRGTVSGELSFNGTTSSSGNGDIRFIGENSGLKFNNTFDISGTGERLFLGKIEGTGEINVVSQAIFDGADTGSDLDLNVSGTLVTRKQEATTDAIINSTINLTDGATLESSDTNFAGAINSSGNTSWNAVGPTTVDGQLNIDSGILSLDGVVNGTGTISVADGADIDLLSGAQLNLDSTVQGTVTDLQTNAQTTLEGGTLDGMAMINNDLIVDTTETSLLNGDIEVNGATTVEEGTLQVRSNALLDGTGDVIIESDAHLNVQGTVTKAIFGIEDSRLSGDGTIFGDVFLEGTLDPGNSAGRLEIDGDVDLTDVSMTDVEIGGLLAGTEYDQVVGLGDAPNNLALGGELNVSLLDGFIPDADDNFVIFDNFLFTGTFSNVTDGRINIAGVGSFAVSFGTAESSKFSSQFLADNGLTFSDFEGIPEPGYFALMAGLLLGMPLRRKRHVTDFV